MAHALYITTFTKKDSIWAEFGFGQKFRSFFFFHYFSATRVLGKCKRNPLYTKCLAATFWKLIF
jgi:hypothetical protein